MTSKVSYQRPVSARGGRKSPNSRGIELEDESWYAEGGKNIIVHNLNRKDGYRTTDLHLVIPKENIDEVIEALKQFK